MFLSGKTQNTTQHNLRTFYILILTQTFSIIGSRISSLAISIWVFTETGNASPLALVSFFAAVPMVMASSISGVMADRWDRRKVMALADSGQAFGTVLLLIAFASNSFELWHLYAVTLIQAIFGVFQGPAFTASVTMLVPEEKRDRANAIQQLSGPLAGIIAPSIAALVYAAADVEGAIIIDLITFLAAMGVVLSVQIPRPTQTVEGSAHQGSVWREMMGGFQYLWTRKTLLMLMLYVSMLNFLLGGSMTLGTPYILARTGNNEVILGVILSIMNVGAILGGLVIGTWGGTRPRIYTILPGIIFTGCALMGFGMAQSPPLLAIALLLTMAPLPMVNAMFMSIAQVKTPPDLQGRVFAIMGQISLLLTPLAYLIVGPLADRIFEPAVGKSGWEHVAPLVGNSFGAGMGFIFLAAGFLTVVGSTFMLALRPIRQMEAHLPDYIPPKSSITNTLEEQTTHQPADTRLNSEAHTA